MRLEATRESKTFSERIHILTNYISPFKQMWPYYWLKVAAVRDPNATIWLLRYFSLTGRWSDLKPIPQVIDKENAIIAISQLIDADRAWSILTSLQNSNTVELLSDVTAIVRPESDMTLPTISYWQERLPFDAPRVLAEVEETANWRYLYISEHQSRNLEIPLYDEENYEVGNRIRKAVQDDLDDKGLTEFASFTSTRLGLGYGGIGLSCSLDNFVYQFDLSLALQIERSSPKRSAMTIPLTIYCQRPLKLEQLRVSVGDIWLPNSEDLRITIETSVEEGWSVGEFVVPYNSGKVWLKFENLTRAISYEMALPTWEDEAAEIVGHIYRLASPDKGQEVWKDHLLTKSGSNFEIALLNAISRFRIPVLFAGQLQTGGTATSGFDLIALNYPYRRAVLISAKGTENNPSQEDCKNLLDAVGIVQETLQGWYVTGILACHATNNKLGLAKKRMDLRLWSREDLELLYQADKRETIDSLLWTPPNNGLLLTRFRGLTN